MDVAEALADLTEISTQIESAVVLDERGEVLGSTLGDEERSRRIARAARELLTAAAAVESDGAGDVVQIEAATALGGVFVVRAGDRAIAATTGRDPTVGLVFYDLKSCLRSVGEPERPPERDAAA